MPEGIYTVHLTAFNAPSAGAELSVAVGGITVNPVNKILYMGKYGTEQIFGGLLIYSGDIWAIHITGTKILKFKTSDLTANGVINPVYGGLNAASGSNLSYIYTDGINIFGLLKVATAKPHVMVWDMTGAFVREQIDDGVADNQLSAQSWAMVSDGTFLYITDWTNRSVKKFQLDGTYIGKSAQNTLPLYPGSMCIGTVSGNLYITDRVGANLVEINPTTLLVVASVTNTDGPATQYPGQIAGEGPNRLFMTPHYYGVTIRGVTHNADERGGFCRYYGRSDTPGGRNPGDLQQFHGCFIGFDGDYLYIWDGAGYDPGYTPVIPYFLHKIYVKEDRTTETAAPVIASEADLKTKMGFVAVVGYKRLDVRDAPDGGRITYYRSTDGAAWVEVTRASGFDLSAHPVASPLYLKAHIDNLAAKVGAPTVYGVDVVAEGSPPDYAALLALYNALLAVYNALLAAHNAVTAIVGTVTAGNTITATIEDETIKAVIEP